MTSRAHGGADATPVPDQGDVCRHPSRVSVAGHAVRIGSLMIFAGLLLAWLWAHTDLIFADGLRYIAQARALEQGAGSVGLRSAVDHPAYPFAVAAAHRLLGGDEPDAWQNAAQLASIVAGVLLVLPLYLVSRELFGDAAAVPACVLFYAVPLTGHVFADTLSESTFLLFWTAGLWAALRFLKSGALPWLPPVVALSALAYLSRPEGLLLPVALVAAIVFSPRWIAGGLRARRGLAALLVLVIGSSCVIGPYVALKGGLGTKPSVARLLGTAPRSAAHAVERQRPLEPGQSIAKTYALAAKAVFKATVEALTWPLVPLALAGLVTLRPRDGGARQSRLLAVICLASVIGLMRLHATGGYCSPRHALILAVIAIPAAAFGLERTVAAFAARVGRGSGAFLPVKAATWGGALVALGLGFAPDTLAPVNEGLGGYRDAARWLAARPNDGRRVVDVTGWSQFYARRDGYTFENLIAAPSDPSARWVVVREAHLRGPWDYCKRLRALVEGLEPVQVFPGSARKGPTRVLVFDREPVLIGRQPRGAAAVLR